MKIFHDFACVATESWQIISEICPKLQQIVNKTSKLASFLDYIKTFKRINSRKRRFILHKKLKFALSICVLIEII
jgi:hypothetical protein